MLSQSLERELVRPQTHRSPNGVFKGLMTGLSGRPPDHLSVSQRNLKKQIRSISRPTDYEPASMVGFELKQSVYYPETLNSLKPTTNSLALKKQPLLSRVKKLDRNDEYFLSRLQENRVSMARERHEKRMEEMQSNRIREQSFKNIKEMIEEIGRKKVEKGDEKLLVESRCSIFDILKESQLHCRGELEELFSKHFEVSAIQVKRQLLGGLKMLRSKLGLVNAVSSLRQSKLQLGFTSIAQATKPITPVDSQCRGSPECNKEAYKALKRLLTHTTKLELLRCFYRFRMTAAIH